MLYNFRFDRKRTAEVLRRIREDNILSQGWGGGTNGNLHIGSDNFVQKCKEFNDLKTTRIATNLTWIREFEDGDLLVVPQLPTDGKASVFVVDGDYPECYRYLENDEFHLNHGIHVRSSFGLDGTISIYNHQLASWCGKLSGLRLPVIRLPDMEATFRKLVHDLKDHPEKKIEESKLDEFLQKVLEDVIGNMQSSLAEIAAARGPINFEAVCKHLLKSWGYRIENQHEYDREGGDIDLRCIRRRTEQSPFETGETTLLVQVKKHMGTSSEEGVKQLLKMLEHEPESDACVMSLGEGFSEKAENLAQQHGITLIDGYTICWLLLGRLTSAE